MYKIALKMLMRSKQEYYSMVLGIAICSMIMVQQPAIFMGIMERTYSIITDIKDTDIWVVHPKVKNMDEINPISINELYKVKGISGIKWAVPFYKGTQKAKMNDGEIVTVNVIGVDDVSLIGFPQKIIEGKKYDIRKEDAVFLDNGYGKTKLYKLRMKGVKEPLKINDEFELNEKRSAVAGYVSAMRNFISTPTLYTTYSNAIKSALPERNMLSAILVKTDGKVSLNNLKRNISEKTGLSAYTNEEFSDVIYSYYFENSGLIVSFGVGISIAFIVGIIIIGQLFYNFTNGNLKFFATFKAMGLDDRKIALMTTIQSTINGVIGFGIGIGLAAIYGIITADGPMGFKLTPQIIVFGGVMVALICIISAQVSVIKIRKAEPAMVFK